MPGFDFYLIDDYRLIAKWLLDSLVWLQSLVWDTSGLWCRHSRKNCHWKWRRWGHPVHV